MLESLSKRDDTNKNSQSLQQIDQIEKSSTTGLGNLTLQFGYT